MQHSLLHPLALDAGADIYQIAKNWRTSVEMIEKYYASHIATSISAAAINVKRRAKSKKAILEHARRNAITTWGVNKISTLRRFHLSIRSEEETDD